VTTNDDVKRRVSSVMASVLGVPAGAIEETTSQETVEGWDSLAHVHLIMGLESEFGVSFDLEQALELTSVRAIHEALAAAGCN
jgi:acyl carrier protein